MGRETNEETIKQLNLNCSQVIRPFLRQICAIFKDCGKDCGQLDTAKVALVMEHLRDSRI
jgi:hypothetical protein